jgi:CHAD domain-containing protein
VIEAEAPSTTPAPSVLAWQVVAGVELSQELARVVHEQCRFLVAWTQQDSLPEAVHRIRQTTKRMRALARLVRRALRRDAFAMWNCILRDQARRLATARDADVLLSSLDALTSSNGVDPARFHGFRQSLDDRAAAARHELASSGALGEVGRTILAVEPTLIASIPRAIDSDDLRRGLRDEFRRARRQLGGALERLDDTSLHEWRKGVKNVRAHVGLVVRSKKSELARIETGLTRAADLLGEDHDLAVLRARVEEEVERASASAGPVLYELLGRIASRKRRIQREALEIGRDLFAEGEDPFAERFAAALASAN